LGLTDADDIELEATLEELALDLRRDAVEADVALGEDSAGHREDIEVEGGMTERRRKASC
jgi:hypothetical protein